MSLQWTFVAGFLYAEIFICLLLCLPFLSPKRYIVAFNYNRIIISNTGILKY